MKKLITVTITAICLFMICLFLCSKNLSTASAAELTSEEIVSERVDISTDTEVNAEAEATEPNNIFTRLWSFTKSHYNEMLSTLLTAGGAIVICLLKHFLARFNTIESSVDVNSSAQAQTVGTVNTMIDVFNEQAKKIKELTESNVDMSKKFNYLTSNYTTLLSQNKAMLNILAVVYQGSKNLPQPIKDIVSTYYAEALKAESGTETEKTENSEV